MQVNLSYDEEHTGGFGLAVNMDQVPSKGDLIHFQEDDPKLSYAVTKVMWEFILVDPKAHLHRPILASCYLEKVNVE